MEKKKLIIIICASVTVVLVILLLASCKKTPVTPSIDDLISKESSSSIPIYEPQVSSTIKKPEEPKDDSLFKDVINMDKGFGKYYIVKNTENVHSISKEVSEEDEVTIVKEYYCQTSDCLITTMESNRYVLIYEDYLYLYDFLKDKQMQLNNAERVISKTSKTFKARFIYKGATPIIISLYSVRATGEKNSLLYLISNNNILFTSDSYLDQSAYYQTNNTIKDGCTFRSASNGRILLNIESSKSNCDLYTVEKANTIYYFVTKEDGQKDIYNNSLTKIKTIGNNIFEVDSSGNFVVSENNTINSYNNLGKLIKSTPQYQKVFLLDRVGVILENDIVKLVDYDGNQIIELTKWKDGMTFSRYSKTKVYNGEDIIHVILKKGKVRYEFLYEFNTKRLGTATIKK